MKDTTQARHIGILYGVIGILLVMLLVNRCASCRKQGEERPAVVIPPSVQDRPVRYTDDSGRTHLVQVEKAKERTNQQLDELVGEQVRREAVQAAGSKKKLESVTSVRLVYQSLPEWRVLDSTDIPELKPGDTIITACPPIHDTINLVRYWQGRSLLLDIVSYKGTIGEVRGWRAYKRPLPIAVGPSGTLTLVAGKPRVLPGLSVTLDVVQLLRRRR